jgi:hypothetical protein
MRAAEIIAAAPDLPPAIVQAIYDLDARAYGRNQPLALDGLQVHARLRSAIEKAGGAAALARQLGIAKQTVLQQYDGTKSIGPTLLRHLGLRKVSAGRTMYTPAD